VVSLLPDNKAKVRFVVPEAQMTRYRPGETMRFHCDGSASGLTARMGPHRLHDPALPVRSRPRGPGDALPAHRARFAVEGAGNRGLFASLVALILFVLGISVLAMLRYRMTLD
jgi:hypothetical protein